MLSANDIKTIRSLREKKYRDSFGLFVVEGEKMVAEALASSLKVEQVIRRDEVGEKPWKGFPASAPRHRL